MDGRRTDVDGHQADAGGDDLDAGRLRFAVLVLAAGAGSRFSPQPGAKLLADLSGRPVLEHVLVAVRAFGPSITVVVLGRGAADIERRLRWHAELRVINRTPERGLASSLQAGFRALAHLPVTPDGVFIVLGDQPHLRPAVMRDLTGRPRPRAPTAGRCSCLAMQTIQGPQPVAAHAPGLGWVDELSGDRGLAPLVASRPDEVREVPVGGSMPDVDEAADLARVREQA